jgi:hypothetical protein
VFCGPACRQQFHSATRRWAEAAVAAGTLSLDQIRNGAAAACTLLPGAVSPAPIDAAPKPAPVAPAESPDEAAELLDDFLLALLDLPGDAWPDLAAALPDEVFGRIDRWMEVRFVS